MFKAIIHNLDKSCKGFKEIQKYNRLIANKKLSGYTLAEKIEAERLWINTCRKAFDNAIKAINEKNNSL